MAKDIIATTEAFVKQELANAEGGHDWWHIYRVRNIGKKIALREDADLLIVDLALLLHDIADSKFHYGDEEIGPKKAKDFLLDKLDEYTLNHVIAIIKNISFKGGKTASTINTLEFKVCQDADRLDAIGAIGVARAFSYGGYKKRLLYDPNIPPNLNMTKEEYKNSTAPTVNHFYEKLLLLKDRMHTETGKKIAEDRHVFMESYLEQFYGEFNGDR